VWDKRRGFGIERMVCGCSKLCSLKQGSTDFPKIWDALQNFGRQAWNKHVSYRGPTIANIKAPP